MKKRSSRWKTAALLLVMVMILGACSSGQENPEQNAQEASALNASDVQEGGESAEKEESGQSGADGQAREEGAGQEGETAQESEEPRKMMIRRIMELSFRKCLLSRAAFPIRRPWNL